MQMKKKKLPTKMKWTRKKNSSTENVDHSRILSLMIKPGETEECLRKAIYVLPATHHESKL